MNDSRLVSILMPVYNVAPYIKEAIDSILQQTYRDFELIILDDCSPDNSVEIIDQYNDERIVRYRGEKNVGLANILNIGMEMARGEYILRMDSDDISLPKRIEVQVKYMEEHPEIDLCSCAMQLFGDREDVWVRDTDVEDVKITALFYSPILHASSIWRRNSFEKCQLRFDQEMVPAEDYDMWVRALCKGLKLVNISDVLYKYRIRGGQAISNIEKIREKSWIVLQNYLKYAFPQLSMDDVQLIVVKDVNSINSLNKLRYKFIQLESLNNSLSNPFLDKLKLHNRLKKYYQNKLYEGLKLGIYTKSVRAISKLRIKQVVKLMINR